MRCYKFEFASEILRIPEILESSRWGDALELNSISDVISVFKVYLGNIVNGHLEPKPKLFATVVKSKKWWEWQYDEDTSRVLEYSALRA